MIKKLEINGVHTTVSNDLRKYINRKIGRLDRFLPKHARESAHAEILIKESKIKQRKQHTCEVILFLPKDTLTVKETTVNPFAAVDIVEETLKNQLKKYKETHSSLRLHRRVLMKIRRSGSA
jgi:putative sigma-54 modulation protein